MTADAGSAAHLGAFAEPRQVTLYSRLGEMTWSELKKVPVVTALPEGARAGSVQDHMYVVHTRNNSADLYSVFRVEWLEPADQCVISWVNVPSPEASTSNRAPN